MILPASSLHFLPLPSSSVMSHQACLWVPTLFSLFFFPLLHPRSGWYEYSCGSSHCSHTDNSSISIFSPDLFSEYQTYSDAWWEPHLQLLWSWVSCHPLQSCPLPRFPWWMVGMLAGVPGKVTLAPFSDLSLRVTPSSQETLLMPAPSSPGIWLRGFSLPLL